MLLEIGLAITLFVSTDIDDLFVLLAFFADRRFKPSQIILGQCLGILILGLTSIGLALAAQTIPPAWIGLLGLLPIALGLKKFYELFSGAEGEDPEEEIEEGWFKKSGKVIAVMGVTVANGGDNLAVYIPLFAAKPPATLALYLAVFLTMTVLWCGLALAVVRQPRLHGVIRFISRYLVPWIFLLLGAYILIEAGSIAYFFGK